MVAIQMRYVTKRVNKRGIVKWYWQRKGFPLKRLSDDPVKRFNEQDRLNKRADAVKSGDGGYGSFSWVVQEYENGEIFKKKARSTQISYGVWLRKLRGMFGNMQFAEIERDNIVDLAEELNERPATRELAIAVMNNLFKVAIKKKLVKENLTRDLDLDLGTSPKRDQVWSADQLRAFMAAAEGHEQGAALKLGMMTMIYTAQRPGDCLAMTWARWSPDGIEVKQQKTGTYLRIWCHGLLNVALQQARAQAKGLRIIADHIGRPITLQRFRGWFNECCEKAGIEDMQLRDLRRTTVVRMAEQKASIPLIASVTGHSYQTATRIVETYLPRTPEMTKAAILTWEQGENAGAESRAQESNRLDSDAKPTQ